MFVRESDNNDIDDVLGSVDEEELADGGKCLFAYFGGAVGCGVILLVGDTAIKCGDVGYSVPVCELILVRNGSLDSTKWLIVRYYSRESENMLA